MIAVAEPVEVGISELSAERARRRSLWGASTITWVLVTSWIVVITPRSMPKVSCTTFTTGEEFGLTRSVSGRLILPQLPGAHSFEMPIFVGLIRLTDIDIDDFDPTRVNVTSSAGSVYLMGLLTPAEADAVTEKVRFISGVKRVVRLFEYIQ